MKKLFLLLGVTLSVAQVYAQNVNIPTTHKTLVMKFTADWCPPCGAYGWTEMEDLVSHAKAGSIKAVVIAVHNSNSNQAPLNINSAYNALRTNLDSNVSGIPSFTVGKLNMAQSNTATVEAKINSVTSAAAEGNVGFSPSWSSDGTSVTVNTTTKFFSAASGTYSVGVYLIEDKVSAKQYNQGTGTYPNSTAVNHHNILRTPATGMTTAFGTQLTGTSFTANQTVTNTFTLPLTSTWNKANFTVFAVLWKKVGAQWEAANANEIASFATGVNGIAKEIVTGVYPNPANDKFTVAIGQSLNNCTITLMDLTGKKVAELYNGVVNSNAIGISLDRPAGLAGGLYMLNVNSDKGTQIIKLQLL